MRKNYKHTTSDNSKDRSCTTQVQEHKLKSGLADKVRQSLIGTMLFCGLTVGTCSIADAAFNTGKNTVLDNNIFGDYVSVYDNNIQPDSLPSKPVNQYSYRIDSLINNPFITSLYNINNKKDIINIDTVNTTDSVRNNIINKKESDSNNSNQKSKQQTKQNSSKNNRSKSSFVEHGIASHMGHALQGRKQASGERHDKNEMICAHKYLPFGTKIRVIDKKTGKSVIVRVTDRGPYGPGRVVDLSLAAAKKLGIEKSGLTRVKIEKVL